MNKKIFFQKFLFILFFSFSFLLLIFPMKSQAIECCFGLCTNERYAECNGTYMDFCSVCSNSNYFYYRCPQISCVGVCSDFICNGICGTDCTTAQDPDCGGSCCGDGTCDTGETSGSCLADCPITSSCVTSGLCDNSCPANCTVADDPDCGGSCCGDGTCDTGETSASCLVDCPITCTDTDNDTYDDCDIGQSGDDGKAKDCDDNNGNINPGESEICDGIDNDCDNNIDEELTNPLNDDQNGVCAGSFKNCSGGGGWVNDYSGVANNEWPNELSCSDGLDNDCDGLTDSLDVIDCSISCAINSDCDDSNPCTVDTCNASNVCEHSNEVNGTQNCGTGCERCWSPDSNTTAVCSPWDTDCDDGSECTTDTCNTNSCEHTNLSNTTPCTGGTCDGLGSCSINNTCTDNDNDGYGNPASIDCVYSSFDCDDNDKNTNPEAVDFCGDGVDQDCLDGDLVCGSLLAIINNPRVGFESSVDQWLNFNAGVTGGKAPYTYQWTSSIDGVIGSGQYYSVDPNTLSIGEHDIGLKVTDDNGDTSLKSVKINIVSSSDLSIDSPSFRNEYSKTENYFDFVNVYGGVMPYTFKWTSDKAGLFSTSQNANTSLSTWSVGAHVVTVEVTDANSVKKTISKNIFIKDASLELYPESGNLFYEGDTIHFNEYIHGGVGPFVYKLNSSIDGDFHTTSQTSNTYDYFSTNSLSTGVHTIKATVVDSNGEIIEKTSQITVSFVPPSMVACNNDSECSDTDPCTIDNCHNPGLASSYCLHSLVNSCLDSDSCCPTTCDNFSDNDCAVIDYDDPSKVLIIYNDRCSTDANNNGVKDSVEKMEYYKIKRGVPDQNILAVNPSVGSAGCSYYYYGTEKYPDFVNEIVMPIQNKLSNLGEDNILYFLLIDLPTRISVTSASHSNRSLDQALMTPYSIPSADSYPEYWSSNPYREASPSVDTDKGHFNHGYKYYGKNIYPVARIQSNQLVDRALYGEKYIYNSSGYYTGTGYLDTRYGEFTDTYLDNNYSIFSDSSSYGKGDRQMAFGKRIYDMTGWNYKWEAKGTEIGETGAEFVDTVSALTAPDALWYEGWYNYGTYHDVFNWKAGAAACDLNSNSGALGSGTSFLKGAFANGLTVGTGVTGEPYLTGHPQPEVFLYYMLNGYNFAESSALSYPGTKWRDISYGDPLYNPNKIKTPIKDTMDPAITKILEKSDPSSSNTDFEIYAGLDINSLEPEVATFKIEYGPTLAYGNVIDFDEIYSTENKFSLSSLTPGVEYNYRITAKDPVGNLSTTPNSIFKTTTIHTTTPSLTLTASSNMGSSPLSVNFTSTSSDSPVSYLWDFGDGNTDVSQNPSHIFSNKGYYNVSLQVKYSSDIKDYKELLIIVK